MGVRSGVSYLIRALTAATPVATGATAQSQAVAQSSAQAQQFNQNSHPRGADGRFINTGGTVQILGPNGAPTSEGQAIVTVTAQGPMIEVHNPTTGAVTTVPPSQVRQAPVSIATLSSNGTNGIPTTPARATAAGKSDALNGLQARTGVDVLGQKASPALLSAYQAAYKAELAVVATRNAKKAAAAKKKAAAAAKKKTGSKAAAPKATMVSNRPYYK